MYDWINLRSVSDVTLGRTVHYGSKQFVCMLVKNIIYSPYPLGAKRVNYFIVSVQVGLHVRNHT